MSWSDLARECGPLAAVWAAAAVGFAAVSARRARRWATPSLAALHRDQTGASYTLGYVLVSPIYLLFAAVTLEATLLMTAKIGTLYAAYAAARSAVVWSHAEPAGLRDDRARQSAWTAMAPIVTLRNTVAAPTGPVPPDAAAGARDFADNYERYSARSVALPMPSRGYPRSNPGRAALEANYRTAAARTQVSVEPDFANGVVTVEVVYRAPFLVPGAGKIIDPDGRWPYEYPLRTRVTLPDEPIVSVDRTLGIDYRSAE